MTLVAGNKLVALIGGDASTGEYYPGRDRRSYGRLCFWREHDGRIIHCLHMLEMAGRRRKALSTGPCRACQVRLDACLKSADWRGELPRVSTGEIRRQ